MICCGFSTESSSSSSPWCFGRREARAIGSPLPEFLCLWIAEAEALNGLSVAVVFPVSVQEGLAPQTSLAVPGSSVSSVRALPSSGIVNDTKGLGSPTFPTASGPRLCAVPGVFRAQTDVNCPSLLACLVSPGPAGRPARALQGSPLRRTS